MKKKLQFLLLLFTPLLFLANMANPWIEGAEHSGIYSLKNCKVEKEFINIKLVKGDEMREAEFIVTYFIDADSDKKVPLVFIGLGLSGSAKVWVNENSVDKQDLNANQQSFLQENINGFDIKFSEKEDHPVSINDLLYFQANFKKGKNKVVIQYRATLSYDRRDFIKEYKLQYSLYPSKFWDSFGPIEVTLESIDDIKFLKSNLGNPTIKNNNYSWKITDKSKDIEIEFSPKYSWLIQFLVITGPFGIACIVSAILLFFHIKILKNRRKKYPSKYNFWVPLGIILNCIVFNAAFIFSFDLLDWLTDKTHQGYYLLAVFVFIPGFLFIYGFLIWFIDRRFKTEIIKP